MCGRVRREKPRENLPRPRLVHHETHMEGLRRELGTPAVGGEHLTACATRPHIYTVYIQTMSNLLRYFKQIWKYGSNQYISSHFTNNYYVYKGM